MVDSWKWWMVGGDGGWLEVMVDGRRWWWMVGGDGGWLEVIVDGWR